MPRPPNGSYHIVSKETTSDGKALAVYHNGVGAPVTVTEFQKLPAQQVRQLLVLVLYTRPTLTLHALAVVLEWVNKTDIILSYKGFPDTGLNAHGQKPFRDTGTGSDPWIITKENDATYTYVPRRLRVAH